MKIKNKSTRKVRKPRKGKRPRKSTKSRKIRGGGIQIISVDGLVFELIELGEYEGGVEKLSDELKKADNTKSTVKEGRYLGCEFARFIRTEIQKQERDTDKKYVFFMLEDEPVGFIQFIIDDAGHIEIEFLCCWYSLISLKPIYPGRSPGQVMMAMFNNYLQNLGFSGRMIYLQSVDEAVNFYLNSGFTSIEYTPNPAVEKYLSRFKQGWDPRTVLYSFVNTNTRLKNILDGYNDSKYKTDESKLFYNSGIDDKDMMLEDEGATDEGTWIGPKYDRKTRRWFFTASIGDKWRWAELYEVPDMDER